MYLGIGQTYYWILCVQHSIHQILTRYPVCVQKDLPHGLLNISSMITMDQVDPQINNYSVSLTISQTWYWIWPVQNGVCQIFHKYSLYVWMDLPDELFNITSLISMVMNLPIRYSPMASYFQLSIIFLTLQILWHAPCQCNPPWHLCDHHRLYPIPTTPSAWYHIGDLPYDLWTMLLYFPFLVSFLLPDMSCHGPTDPKSLDCVVRTLPYVSLHTNLVLILLIICI